LIVIDYFNKKDKNGKIDLNELILELISQVLDNADTHTYF